VTSSWFFLSTLNYDARSTTHQNCNSYSFWNIGSCFMTSLASQFLLGWSDHRTLNCSDQLFVTFDTILQTKGKHLSAGFLNSLSEDVISTSVQWTGACGPWLMARCSSWQRCAACHLAKRSKGWRNFSDRTMTLYFLWWCVNHRAEYTACIVCFMLSCFFGHTIYLTEERSTILPHIKVH